jgi:DNA-binding transcriptional ArsR family regulator
MTAAVTTLPSTTKTTPISSTDAVSALAALGNTLRLQAYRHILNAGTTGLNVGALQSLLGTPASTLNHHLNTLVRAGIIMQKREGREIYNIANTDHMHAVINFLDMLQTPSGQDQRPQKMQGVA